MATSSSDVVAGTNGTAVQYNNLRADVVLGKGIVGTETDGATVTIDWTDTTKGKIRTITMAGSRTFVFSGAAVGQVLGVRFVQDATGNRVPTLPANTTLPSGATVVPWSTAANKIDFIIFVCTSATPTYDALYAGIGNS